MRRASQREGQSRADARMRANHGLPHNRTKQNDARLGANFFYYFLESSHLPQSYIDVRQ